MSVQHAADHNFKNLLSPQGVTLVDFGAPWCPPCKTLLPILDELDQELGGSAVLLTVNVEESPETAAQFGVMSMPTVFVFKDAEPVDKLVGLRTKEAYQNLIARHQ
jgi:thioredoxin 1